MKVECVSKGKNNIKNLTVGNQYEIDHNEGDFYHLVNDEGQIKRYSKNLFKEVNLQKDFDINNFTMANNGTLTYENNTVYNNHVYNLLIAETTNEESEISCGIREVSGLNGLFNRLYSIVSTTVNNIQSLNIVNINKAQLCEHIFTKTIKRYLDEKNKTCAYLLFSTNLENNPSLSQLEQFGFSPHFVLEELSSVYLENINPNSENGIGFWIFEMNKDN